MKQVELDPFTAEILRDYLITTVEEMVSTTLRSAYSTAFSEGRDFSCAIFDPQGRMVAQAAGCPVHYGSLFDAVEAILREFPEFEEGDVALHNDPFDGGSHHADVVVLQPVFHHGLLLGFAVNRGHWVDIGSMAAGGYSGTARHVIQEGIIIPPIKLYKAGTLDTQLRSLLFSNVRAPRMIWGDLQSQIASGVIAARRIQALADKYGSETVLTAMESALDYTRRRFRTRLAEIPNGTWSADDYMDDDAHSNRPYRMHVTVRKEDDKVYVDYTGTDPQAPGPINMTFPITKASAYSALAALVDPEIPINSGFLDLVEVFAPEGTMVNPVYPAPIFLGTADPSSKSIELIIRAMAPVLPERVVAGSYTGGNNTTAWHYDPVTRKDSLIYMWSAGGCGARAACDGNNSEWHVMANCVNHPIELYEARHEVIFQKQELRIDSGGAGKYRGGLGHATELKFLNDTLLSCCGDRHIIPPWGLFGGKEGAPNQYYIIRDGRQTDFKTLFGTVTNSKVSEVPLKAGDIFGIAAGGGGGYGDPLERDPSMVERDFNLGYLSIGKAADDYGVVIDQSSHQVDQEATKRLRAKRKQAKD